MAYQYDILARPPVLLVKFSGRLLASELIAAAQFVTKDDRYATGLGGLVDLTAVEVGFSHESLAELIQFTRGLRPPRARWAALVSSPLATACAMLFQRRVCDLHPFAIFSTIEVASVFLGFPGTADLQAELARLGRLAKAPGQLLAA